MKNTIDAGMLSKMFLAGAENLEQKKEWINELNVFPVPDGDTGTNMTMTIMAAAKEVKNLKNPTMQELAKAISFGSLRGARGNSGVILSQLFRGFTRGIKDLDQIDAMDLANAFQKAVETAYKAVMKPKEGTILTVAKGVADKASELAIQEESDDLVIFMEKVIEHAEYVLSQTPEMLPVLKQAGVVDSGGQGLLEVLRGAFDAFMGKEVTLTISNNDQENKIKPDNQSNIDIKFGYCTEFIIKLENEYLEKTEIEFKKYLTSIGDSIVVVSDEDIVKVHVHTNDPGLAIQRALTYGSLTNIKIDNMREEHEEKVIKDAQKIAESQLKENIPPKEVGFISVSIGEGMNEIFKGLGVDYIIEGGQTMNPSTEDMINAIERVNAKNIFILPNNKNIILAANQAQELITDKKVIVIPTKTIPQGITALINFIPDRTLAENEKQMLEEIARVKTGQVTYAVRDTNIDGKEISQNDIMGIGDSSILSVGTDIKETTKDMIDQLVDSDSELISIYFGEEIEEKVAELLVEELEETYKNCDIELHWGGQPIYYYVISVE